MGDVWVSAGVPPLCRTPVLHCPVDSESKGSRMPIKLQKIHLTSSEEIDVADGLTVIVGPNNVGKTLLLFELYHKLAGLGVGRGPLVVDRVEFDRTHTLDELLEWLDRTYGRRKPGVFQEGQVVEPSYKPRGGGDYLLARGVRSAWSSSENIGKIALFVVRYMTAQERLNMGFHSEPFNLHTDRPSSPVQHLYMDRAAERLASNVMLRALSRPFIPWLR